MRGDSVQLRRLAMRAERGASAEHRDGRETTFVERSTYRKRRIRDLSRLMPLAGFLLLLVPLNFPLGGGVVRHLLVVFGIWLLLVLVALFCAQELRPEHKPKGSDRPA